MFLNFDTWGLSVLIKREAYHAVMLYTLLHKSVTWVVKSPSIKRLEGLHNHCIQMILDAS